MDETKKRNKMIIVLGSPGDGAILLDEIKVGATVWTMHRHAQNGDRVLFYITAPTSAIVAAGTLCGDVSYQGDESQPWFKHFFGEVRELKSTSEIKMRVLREVFPEWRALRYFRQNAIVPQQFENLLTELLEGDGNYD